MMKNHDQSVEKNHNPNWLYIPDHSYRILIIVGLGSRKTNLLLKHQRPIDKKFYTSKNHSNQSISCFLMEEKK